MGLADALIPGVASSASNLVARRELRYKEFTSSGTLTVGSGGDISDPATVLNIVLVGGGGGGGMGSVTNLTGETRRAVAGGAGGGGEVRQITIPAIALTNGSSTGTATVTIGAGGVGGASSNGGTAGLGGDSYIGEYGASGGGSGRTVVRASTNDTFVGSSERKRFTSGANASSAERIACGGSGGGGQAFNLPNLLTISSTGTAYIFGEQNGRTASSTASATKYSPDSEIPFTYIQTTLGTLSRAPGGQAGATYESSTSGQTAWYARGGKGMLGLGGGGAGGFSHSSGSAISYIMVLPTTYWATDYNLPQFYSVDGGGRGAIVSGVDGTTIAAGNGLSNTGGGGGGGAAFAASSDFRNTVSSGGSGASGYCIVYWWE